MLLSERTNLFDSSVNNFRINGVLINSSNGYPLSAMNILLSICIEKMDSQGGSTERIKKMLLAEDISDLHGHFSFFIKPSTVVQFSAKFNQGKNIFYILRISSDERKLVGEYPLEFRPVIERLVLNIPIANSSVSRRTWKDVATRMRQGRLIKVNELVRELSGVTPKQMLFTHLSLETRQSIIAELDKYFLDTNGILDNISRIPGFHKLRDHDTLLQYLASLGSKVQKRDVRNAVVRLEAKLDSFHDLFDVDWPVNLDALQSGKIGEAIQNYENIYRFQNALEGETNK
jgi:hypothetical protein